MRRDQQSSLGPGKALTRGRFARRACTTRTQGTRRSRRSRRSSPLSQTEEEEQRLDPTLHRARQKRATTARPRARPDRPRRRRRRREPTATTQMKRGRKGEGTGSERCASTALRRTASGPRPRKASQGQQRPDNPPRERGGGTSELKVIEERTRPCPRGSEGPRTPAVLAWMGMRPVAHRDLQTV